MRTCSNKCIFATKDKDYEITKWYRCSNAGMIQSYKEQGLRIKTDETGLAVVDYNTLLHRECTYYHKEDTKRCCYYCETVFEEYEGCYKPTGCDDIYMCKKCKSTEVSIELSKSRELLRNIEITVHSIYTHLHEGRHVQAYVLSRQIDERLNEFNTRKWDT